MKKQLLIIAMLFLSISAFAQRPERPNKEKLKALKIAHITEELNLTSKEAQDFWPVYNANEEARDQAREKLTKNIRRQKPEDLTEAEAKAFIDNTIAMEEMRLKLQKEYYARLQKVISAKKIMKLMEADRSFRRKMINEFKQRHRGEKERTGPPRDRN